jgi:hypothetical protein
MIDKNGGKMKVYNPHGLVSKAQFYKYKVLSIPAIIIVINFFFVSHVEQLKYVSFLALALYFFCLYLYRISRTYVKPQDNCVIAPIQGTITQIDETSHGHIITIKKPFFAPCEFFTTTDSDIPNELHAESENVSWQIEGISTDIFRSVFCRIFIDETVDYQGVLVGVIPGSATCEVCIPHAYTLTAEVGSELHAGLSVLAEMKTSQDTKDDNHE